MSLLDQCTHIVRMERENIIGGFAQVIATSSKYTTKMYQNIPC